MNEREPRERKETRINNEDWTTPWEKRRIWGRDGRNESKRSSSPTTWRTDEERRGRLSFERETVGGARGGRGRGAAGMHPTPPERPSIDWLSRTFWLVRLATGRLVSLIFFVIEPWSVQLETPKRKQFHEL